MTPKQARVKARDKRLRTKYGLSAVQWTAMFQLQNGLCPICLKPIQKPWNKEGKLAASVDHDHRSGRVRGLLHFRCNRYYVGRMTAAVSRRVTEYLESTFDGRNL